MRDPFFHGARSRLTVTHRAKTYTVQHGPGQQPICVDTVQKKTINQNPHASTLQRCRNSIAECWQAATTGSWFVIFNFTQDCLISWGNVADSREGVAHEKPVNATVASQGMSAPSAWQQHHQWIEIDTKTILQKHKTNPINHGNYPLLQTSGEFLARRFALLFVISIDVEVVCDAHS